MKNSAMKKLNIVNSSLENLILLRIFVKSSAVGSLDFV